jgi:hypothetical protein
MNHRRSLRAPALLIAALAALLIFAAAASAETRTGESTSVTSEGAASPEATLTKASASYESTGGTVSFDITTAAVPQELDEEGEPSETEMEAELITATSGCNLSALEHQAFSFPLFAILSEYGEPTSAEGILVESMSGGLEPIGPATKSLSGTTTTLAFTSGAIENQGFNCAVAAAMEEGAGNLIFFPISVPPAPPAAPTPPAPAPAPAPGPAPALSIAKAKPLKLKVGTSRTVKVKVTDTGTTATAQGSLRVKAAKGVLVKPEVQKLPVLAPGASWTVSVRVQLTEKARQKSTLALTGTASGVTATGSLVVKVKE